MFLPRLQHSEILVMGYCHVTGDGQIRLLSATRILPTYRLRVHYSTFTSVFLTITTAIRFRNGFLTMYNIRSKRIEAQHVQLAECRGGRSNFFRLRLPSCSKILNPDPVTESESLKFSTTPTPQVENPSDSDSDSSTPTPQPCGSP